VKEERIFSAFFIKDRIDKLVGSGSTLNDRAVYRSVPLLRENQHSLLAKDRICQVISMGAQSIVCRISYEPS